MRVRIEIVPYGEEDKAYEIERLDIFNKGRIGISDLCNYGVIHISEKDAGMYDDVVLHSRKDGALVLVERVLTDLINNHGDNHVSVRTPNDVGNAPTE